MNAFGGNWTHQKIRIIEEYAKAYLHIMKNHPYWKLLYFDGFAGSGQINIGDTLDANLIEGAARRIAAITEPKMFDTCYFVELDEEKARSLKAAIAEIRKAGVCVVEADCNQKLHDMANFLKSIKGKNHKVLAFIDPCGMEVNWHAIESLKGLPVDMWLLIPTGIGVNRLLKKDSNIPEAWWQRLEAFYGLPRDMLNKSFYSSNQINTLFGEETVVNKIPNALRKIQEIYISRLLEVFAYVSKPYVLSNINKSVMFHFVLASNNKTAVNIANDIINKFNREIV